MDPHTSSQVHADAARRAKEDDVVVVLAVDVEAADGSGSSTKAAAEADHPSDGNGGGINYMARAQWLRAAVLGANDGLVSVASLMIGISAVNDAGKTMFVTGLGGLVAGACSMAIGEFVSVYAQYDIEVSQMKRDRDAAAKGKGKKENLPSPTRAALASALAFAVGALVPLLAGGFVRQRDARVAAVCAATTVGLAGFGASGGYLGGASMARSGFRVLVGGWLAMAVTYGVLWVFAKEFHVHASSLA